MRFFKAIASIVEICVKLQVEPFLETVKAIVAADGTDPNRDLKIGDYTITDFERTVSDSPFVDHVMIDY